ncbi:MAG: GTP 3',8-cyclase MoaA [Opitutae bacterium]|nr:GTP 3',8-cyclase MoaA [Opitutae bacterium]
MSSTIFEMTFPKDNLNRPLRDLRISVTDRCNLRCEYCMPAEIFGPDYPFLPKGDILAFGEISRLANLFVKCGVEKIRLTGGEPLLRDRLPDLVSELAKIDGLHDLALTTNGLRLEAFAIPLRDAGLQRVTVSLDALSRETAKRLNGSFESTNHTLNGIAAAKEAGLEVKINTVIKRGVNEHEILPLANRFRGSGTCVRFIEYMDAGNYNGWDGQDVVRSNEVLDLLKNEHPLEAVPPRYQGEVAKRYKYLDGAGEVGFISSVSEPFCGDCCRARLTADGKLVTCLFAKNGHDLRVPLRDGLCDKDLLEIIKKVWRLRQDRYSELRHQGMSDSGEETKVEMSYVGG